MSMKFCTFILLMALLGSTGCTPSITSETLANPAYEVSAMKTYAWAPKPTLTVVGVLVGSPTAVLEKETKRIFKEAMTTKGYSLVKATENPDFLVAFTAGAGDRATDSVHTVTRDRAYSQTTAIWSQTNDSLQGGLAITFLTPDGTTDIWKGLSSDRISPRDARQDDAPTLNRLISHIMSSVPDSI
jgi:hypothetical protein